MVIERIRQQDEPLGIRFPIASSSSSGRVTKLSRQFLRLPASIEPTLSQMATLRLVMANWSPADTSTAWESAPPPADLSKTAMTTLEHRPLQSSDIAIGNSDSAGILRSSERHSR